MSTQFVKNILFKTIQVVMYNNSVYCKYSFNVKNSSISNYSVYQIMQFKCKYILIGKNISSYSV